MEEVSSSPVFHATTEQSAGPETKVYVDDRMHVLWNAGDLVSIFPKTTRNKKYRFIGQDGFSGGDFEDISSSSGTFGSGQDIPYNYAVYPYNENTNYVFDDTIATFFPKEQYYRAGSFGLNANLMVAKSSDYDLNFKNVGGYLCLPLYGEGMSVRSIILQGNNGETLSGPVKVSFGEGNIPAMKFDTGKPSDLDTKITLKTSDPVALGSSAADSVVFWIVVPPTTFTGGFTVTVIDSQGGEHVKSTTKLKKIERNKQTLMRAFEIAPEPLAPASAGIHSLSGDVYEYDKTTDQVNIYEVGDNAWVRFLLIPTLTMYEIGPIPLDATAGSSFTADVTTYVEGVETGTVENCLLTVQYIEDGMMSLVSDEGDRYVFRFN